MWCASLNSAGGLLATGDKSGEICLWEWPPNEEAKPEIPKTAYTDSFFSRDSQKLFVSNHPTAGNSFTSAYDFSNQKNHSYDFPQMPIGTDAQGNLIVLMKESSTLEFFTPDGKTLVKKIKLAIDQLSLNINHVRQGVNKQGTRFYWLSRDNTQIHYVDFSTGKCAYYSGLPAAECIGATISYDGRWIAAASWDHLHVYDTTTQTLKTIPNERHWASAMAFHPDHKRLITAGIDGTLRIHSLPDLTVVATLRGHLENANGIAISPDGLTIASVENDAGIKLWRLDTLREVVDLKIPNTMGEIFFSPDGSRLAFSVRDKAGGAAIHVLEAK